MVIAAERLRWDLKFILVGAICLSPPFAFLMMQGLETTVTALLIYVIARTNLAVLSNPSVKSSFAFFGSAFLGALARPDTVVFAFGVFMGTAVLIVLRRDYKFLARFLSVAGVFVILGIVYVLWRVSYFGHFFPNTFYVKVGVGGKLVAESGIGYVKSFFISYFMPYCILVVFFIGRYYNKEILIKVSPVILGVSFFVLYLVTVTPYQGHYWRYIFPVFIAFLYSAVYYFSVVSSQKIQKKSVWVSAGLVLFFALWTLRFAPSSFYEKERRAEYDRVAVGRALAGIPATMLTTESGALPYYSGWRSFDVLGLNSEEIARNGLSRAYLEKTSPDLVALLGYYGDKNREMDFRIIEEYMAKKEFVAVAVIYKSFNAYHSYFVNPDSKYFGVITERLLGVDRVTYADMEKRMFKDTINAYDGCNK
jgi:arabinofuranosyltransferase